MRHFSPALALVLVGALGTADARAQARRPMTFADFAAVRNVSDPQLSPDGRRVLYAVRTTDVDANRRTTFTYVMPLAGGAARRFPDDSVRATEARWSPDGLRVAYVAGGQLWIADADGANRRQLTRLSGGATGVVWAPTGDRIAFTSAVYPDCRTDECNVRREREREQSQVRAYIADNLLYRHWNAWSAGTRSHLFVVAPDGSGLRDVTEGAPYDVPPPPFGGSEAYAFAPDGRELAYTAKDQGREQAWSTDLNVYVVSVAGGSATVITLANKGADANPVYSPDGRWIAFASQERAGFESDRWRLMMYDRRSRQAREALVGWDRSADAYLFSPSGDAVFVMAQDRGRDKLFRAPLAPDGRAGTPAVVVADGNNTSFSLSRDGRTLAWLRDAAHRPHEVYVAGVDRDRVTGARQLTRYNDALIAQLQLHPLAEYWFRGANGDSVHGFVLRPPQWSEGRRFPAVLLVHGGPQGAWLDTWHSRWSYQMFASPGFGLVIVNPRGSTGYGQRFVDDVSRDWGGKVFTDLMNGLDAAAGRYAWLDTTRLGAAGGSFGGYMVNWLAGHSNRFDALVSHAGVFNLEAMGGATEELWFIEWEFGGPWWDSTAMAQQYRRWSPHLAAGNFRTPTLVLHGELDYRVPYTEGISMFTALQRKNVPSRLVVFPDEGHWIGKPQNQRLWWHEVLGWLRKYLAADASASR